MKCKSCGANYRARELKCPYCGTPNPRGLLWQRERQAAEAEYERVGSEVVPILRRRAANHILNRMLIIEAGLFALLFIGLIMIFFMGDMTGSLAFSLNREEAEAELASLYEQERFGELYARLSELDIIGEEYYEYSQICLLHYDYEDFTGARMALISLRDAGEEADEYDIERLIDSMNDVLSAYIPAYPELTERNGAHLKKWQADVEQFAAAMLGMDAGELDILRKDYITIEETDALVRSVLQRRAWEQ